MFYNTGAGHSDATLGDWDGGRWGFLNDTMMQFNFNGYPWNFEMGSDTTYNGMSCQLPYLPQNQDSAWADQLMLLSLEHWPQKIPLAISPMHHC